MSWSAEGCKNNARWEDFLKVLQERKVGGVPVCESPLLEEDTLLIQEAFGRLQERKI